MPESTYPQVPVVVVGGGSVGLLTADLLHHHGVSAVVVERRSGPSVHPRATGIGPRSVEILRELGLDDEVGAVSFASGRPLGKATARTLVELGEGGGVVTAPWAQAPPTPVVDDTTTPFRLRGLCAQDRLDAVVAADLRRRGVDVRWSTRLVSVAQDAAGVDVVLEGPTGRHRLRAAHLVAADGTHSSVRRSLGIATSGPGDLGRPRVNILFRADLRPYLGEVAFATCTITHPDAPGLLGTINGADEWVFHAPADEDEDLADFTPERCAALVRCATGDPGLAVEVRSTLPWRPRGLLADRFADGRVFLVGDAAHTVSPIGAFGLNTGIADAHNLAWKLAAVGRGDAGSGLLDTYAQEREPVAAATLDQAVRRMADPKLHWGQGPEAEAARAAAGVWAAPVVHYGERYASTAVVDPGPPLPSTTDLGVLLDGSPGSRVPHAWTDATRRVSTLDLVRSRWTLLTGRRGDPWLDAAAAVGQAAHRLAVPLIGLADEGAMLVRPDAVVAFRAGVPPERPARLLAEVMDRLTARTPVAGAAAP